MTRLKITIILSLFSTILFEKCVHGGEPSTSTAPAVMGCDSSCRFSRRPRSDLDQTESSDYIRTMQHESPDSQLGEDELNRRGCALTASGQYQEAYNCFTLVIMINPKVSKYFYNRALCAIRLERFKEAISDSEKALAIDPWSVKANFFLGSAYLQMENYNEAVIYLFRAFDSAKEQRQSYGDDIAFQLRLARRMKWRMYEDQRLASQNKLDLFPYLKLLLREAREEEISRVHEASAASGSQDSNQQALEQQNKEIEEIEEKFRGYMTDITDILSKAEEKTKRRELPDYLSGRMSYKILSHNATITPSGDTFEKEVLQDHFRRYDFFDPLHPNTVLNDNMLVPNLAMNDAAEAFINENDWLEEFENYVSNFDVDEMDI